MNHKINLKYGYNMLSNKTTMTQRNDLMFEPFYSKLIIQIRYTVQFNPLKQWKFRGPEYVCKLKNMEKIKKNNTMLVDVETFFFNTV